MQPSRNRHGASHTPDGFASNDTRLENHEETHWSFLESRRQVILLIVFAVLAVTAVMVYRDSLAQLREASEHQPLTVAGRPPRATDEFDLSNSLVPAKEIRPGGPRVDGIPAITQPRLLNADAARFLRPTDPVIGVAMNGDARAYPLRILDRHEIVNDQIGAVPFAVTYCPLCDSSVVFDRRSEDGTIEFGVSGKLYNSNVLMYDRPSSSESSLWSQMRGGAITGPRAGAPLRTLPLEVVAWGDWKSRYPDTRVLATEGGRIRQLGPSLYEGYFRSASLMFPVEPLDDRLPTKTPILGVWGQETARAYPISAFADVQNSLKLPQEIDGVSFTLGYEPDWKSLRIVAAEDGLQWVYSYWFAWAAFHEATEIFVLE